MSKEAQLRFRQRRRETLEDGIRRMSEEDFSEMVARMRKRRGGRWYADKLLEIRKAGPVLQTPRRTS